MTAKIVLVTGGARSGKSLFAERYAAAYNCPVGYIATAQIYDQEMQARVTRHRERRPADWYTVEAPYAAHEALAELAAKVEVIVFDCLTLYISNLMLWERAPKEQAERYQFVMAHIDKLMACAAAQQATVIFVTNEVGDGIVPDNALAREYRDLAGSVNQKVAAHADEVYLVVCGLPVELKQLAKAPDIGNKVKGMG